MGTSGADLENKVVRVRNPQKCGESCNIMAIRGVESSLMLGPRVVCDFNSRRRRSTYGCYEIDDTLLCIPHNGKWQLTIPTIAVSWPL